MVSLDLVRRLKLKQCFCEQFRVSGLGGVPTVINARAEVKITLGPRVVYVVELWVANIGDGIDVLLGMDFMYSAGVRLCAREGLVMLPDEETVLISRRGADHDRQHVDIPVNPTENLCLRPGEHAVVRIQYGQTNPQRETVWAGRGDRWVTQIIYAVKAWAVAVKVVNISKRNVWIDTRSPIARIIEFGCFPKHGRFVRPGLRRYQEWQRLIFENTISAQVRLLKNRLEQMSRTVEPPFVQKKDYPWPEKLLTKSHSRHGTALLVQLQPLPSDVLTASQNCSSDADPEAVTIEGRFPEAVIQNKAAVSEIIPDEEVTGPDTSSSVHLDVDPEDLQCCEHLAKTNVVPTGDVDSDGDEFFDSFCPDTVQSASFRKRTSFGVNVFRIRRVKHCLTQTFNGWSRILERHA